MPGLPLVSASTSPARRHRHAPPAARRLVRATMCRGLKKAVAQTRCLPASPASPVPSDATASIVARRPSGSASSGSLSVRGRAPACISPGDALRDQPLHAGGLGGGHEVARAFDAQRGRCARGPPVLRRAGRESQIGELVDDRVGRSGRRTASFSADRHRTHRPPPAGAELARSRRPCRPSAWFPTTV